MPLRAADEVTLRRALDELLTVVENEKNLTERLVQLAQEVQQRLLVDDYDALLESAREQETFAQQLAQWEQRRLLLARVLNANFPGLSRLRLSQWVDRFPEPHAARMHTFHAQLQRATTQLQTVNRQNQALIQRSLRFADMALGVESSTYALAHGRNVRSDAPQLLDTTF